MQILPEHVAVEDSVIVHFKLRDDDVGTEADSDFIIELDLALSAAIEAAGVGSYDYHETGEGWARLFAYGPDADSLAFVIRQALVDRSLPAGAYMIKEFVGVGGRTVRESV